MIHALVNYYETLKARGEIEPTGWKKLPIGYAIYLDDNGGILDIVSLEHEISQGEGKKPKKARPEMVVPSAPGRTGNIISNALCDKGTYFLGIDKAKTERVWEQWNAAKTLHEEILADVDHPSAKALLSFFANWNPEKAEVSEVIQNKKDGQDGLIARWIVFRHNGQYIHDIPEIAEAVNKYRNAKIGDNTFIARCSVTGRLSRCNYIHTPVGMGTKVVSFDKESFAAHGWDRAENAPISQEAENAYTAAMTYLERNHSFRIGEMTVITWAQDGNKAYPNTMARIFGRETYNEEDILQIVRTLAQGKPCQIDGDSLDPEMPFYIAGYTISTTRPTFHFFEERSFGAFAKNIEAHYERMEIIGKKWTLNPWQILKETVPDGVSKFPDSQINGLMQAILFGHRYPQVIVNNVIARICAEREVTANRAAIIKMYYIRNQTKEAPTEVMHMELNETSVHKSYLLGRMFAIAAYAEYRARGTDSTRSNFLASAMRTPAAIFPTVFAKYTHHLEKLDDATRGYCEKKMAELSSAIGSTFPRRLTQKQAGAFIMGYYHQRNNTTKKEVA